MPHFHDCIGVGREALLGFASHDLQSAVTCASQISVARKGRVGNSPQFSTNCVQESVVSVLLAREAACFLKRKPEAGTRAPDSTI